MANQPLDAGPEDDVRRGFRRPSINFDPLAKVSETLRAIPRYDNSREGFIGKDNIWPQLTEEEIQQIPEAARRAFLEARNLIPPAAAIPTDVPLPETMQAVEDAISGTADSINSVQESVNAALAAAGGQPRDSYGQTLNGQRAYPSSITTGYSGPISPPESLNRETFGGNSSVYAYTPIDLYDDRYDWNTGIIVRDGIASGTGGTIGGPPGSTVGSPGFSPNQSEARPAPPNVTPNDTSQGTYDDAILRQARAGAADGTAWTQQDAENVERLRSFNDDLGGGRANASLTPAERAYAVHRGYIQRTVDRTDDARASRTTPPGSNRQIPQRGREF